MKGMEELSKNGQLVLWYSSDLVAKCRCKSLQAQQKVQEQLKKKMTDLGVKCRVLRGAPPMRRVLEQGPRTAFKAIKALACASDEQPSLATRWPRSLEQGAWCIMTDNQQGEIIVAGKHDPLKHSMSITIKKKCSSIHRASEAGTSWKSCARTRPSPGRFYPYLVEWAIVDSVKNPIVAKPPRP